jgi:cell division protein FtsB
MTRRRLAVAFLVLAVLFALAAGEYDTLDWLHLERRVRAEREEIARLQREVDSLRREARAVETDPAVQERLARELYGMIREGEFVYNILRADTGGR